MGMCSFGGFLPHWQCIVHHSIWDLYKNGWTDHVVVLDDEWTWPKEQCVTWGWRSPNGMYYDKNKTGWVKLWRSGKSVRHINEVTLRPARLVLGWGGASHRYVISHPGQLSPYPQWDEKWVPAKVRWCSATGESRQAWLILSVQPFLHIAALYPAHRHTDIHTTLRAKFVAIGRICALHAGYAA